jgi:tRNA threonylcarbamoyl adenosine modification protein YeaZ
LKQRPDLTRLAYINSNFLFSRRPDTLQKLGGNRMLILAVEQSTVESSAVVSDDSEVLTSVSWQESRIRSQQFFPKIEALLSQAGKKLKDIDLFAAGTGPGAFNALRMCVSALHAFSLPDSKPLYAVGSAQALALQIHGETGKNNISVVGDARRGHLWLANCTFSGAILPASYELTLTEPDQLADNISTAEVIASPDFERIPGILGSVPSSSTRLKPGPVYPHARFIAETAFAAASAGIPSPEMAPTYQHPAV